MRLADFIVRNIEPILVEWEAFAATMRPAARSMDSSALRDHADQILLAVAKDISTPQTTEAQREKSLGHASVAIDATETAAQTHAVLRARHGFDINQLTAEYRALRANVLRLWIDECRPDAPNLDDMIRFNEAIDQALTESVLIFTEQVEQARNLLLGMLGHDMRSPLQTIQLTASYLAALNAGEHVTEAAARLIRSGARMQSLLDDLCDFNRTQLGLGINIAPHDVDLKPVLADVVDELRAANPGRQIALEIDGDLRGRWDEQRMQQLLSNLVINAIKYGSPDGPVQVIAAATDGDVRIEVKNHGEPIDPQTLARIFDPLQRGADQKDKGSSKSGLGLGLYIASEIARARHGGIHAKSDANETAFVVRVPRQRRD